MLFNKDYLFIHIPRTGGKCIKSAIIPFLEKPIYLAQKNINKKYFNNKDFISINKFLVHSSLDEIEFLKNIKNPQEIKNERLSNMYIENQYLPDLKTIKNIIICLRDPLERTKSLYKYQYFKKNYTEDFETFTGLLGKGYEFFSNTKNYCTINNEIPQNVKFIKFSNLEEDLCNLLSINKINLKSKKHNEIKNLNDLEKKEFFKVKNIGKVVDSINTWEEWAIQKGLLNPITEKDFL